MKKNKKFPYELSLEELSDYYQTNLDHGLTKNEAKNRLKIYGLNKLPIKEPDSWLIIFIKQFKSPLIYVLLIAATIIGLTGEWVDAFIIIFVIAFNATIATIHESRAQKTLIALSYYIPSKCSVIRDSQTNIINVQDLVQGDVILLQEGEQVPADARLIETYGLKVDESILSGESTSIEKNTNVIAQKVSIYEQINMVFKGTTVLTGNAKAVVVATGLNTEVGKIQQEVEIIEQETPLKKELEKLSKWIIGISITTCLLFIVTGLIWQRTIKDLLLFSAAFFVAVVPEGLPVVLSLILASGAYKMAKSNMLIKKLEAVEALGRTDVIVMDKTGTLTYNEMMVYKTYVDGKIYEATGTGYFSDGKVFFNETPVDLKSHPILLLMAKAGLLLDTSVMDYDEKTESFFIKGEPMHAAMRIFAQKLGLEKKGILKQYKKLYEIPFDPNLRMQIGLFEQNKIVFCFASGSPEAIAQACISVDQDVENILSRFLNEGLRVIALAYKELNFNELPGKDYYQQFIKNKIIGSLNFLGLYGIQDAIRKSVRNMIENARNSGLEIIMATGDHMQTAEFVAQKTGILRGSEIILSGQEFSKMSDNELKESLNKIRVYARVTPQNKVRLIKLLKGQGKLTAMVGDGVNDAPSIMASDLGIAMGKKGTEVAKDAADMILLDDSFFSIIKAIELGRHIFYTLRRVILYLMATNFGEILVIMLSLFIFQSEVPLLPVHILWINIVTDGFLDIALSTEKPEKNILQYSWLKKLQKNGLINLPLIFKILFFAFFMCIGSVFIFYLYKNNIEKARTMTLLTMAAFQWFNAWNCRSENLTLLQIGFLSNFWLSVATFLVVFLQIGVTYIPFLQRIFKTVPLTLFDWFLAIGISFSILLVEELRKCLLQRKAR